MEKISIALDWTPNTNHTGFFCALELGFYQEAGIQVALQHPGLDNYLQTPAKKVELGLVDFSLCPLESLISYRTKTNPFPLTAVACILQEDLSAIACLEEKTIQSPAELDGRTYASYQARYEDGIVREMIRNAGGKGDLSIVYPKKLGIWSTLLEGKADATWIFSNWEGLQAKAEGVALRQFRMKDFDIPYSYSPVIAGGYPKIEERATAYRSFLAATRRGFVFALDHPEAAAKILQPHIPDHDRSIDLVESQRLTNQHMGIAANWGQLDAEKIRRFLDWLREKGLEKAPVQAEDLVCDL
jgi:ABC-type nitrate/sulfonate/bicarbonate transport system substrate-binding protein